MASCHPRASPSAATGQQVGSGQTLPLAPPAHPQAAALKAQLDDIEAQLKDIDKQKESQELRIAKVQERLLKQFNAMDALVSQLNSTSDRLTQSLGSLPGFVKQDS